MSRPSRCIIGIQTDKTYNWISWSIKLIRYPTAWWGVPCKPLNSSQLCVSCRKLRCTYNYIIYYNFLPWTHSQKYKRPTEHLWTPLQIDTVRIKKQILFREIWVEIVRRKMKKMRKFVKIMINCKNYRRGKIAKVHPPMKPLKWWLLTKDLSLDIRERCAHFENMASNEKQSFNKEYLTMGIWEIHPPPMFNFHINQIVSANNTFQQWSGTG